MISTGNSSETWETIKEQITEEQILNYYLGISYIPCLINAPYRKDNKPSLSFYYHTIDKCILFKDFATNTNGDIPVLLSKMWNISYKNVINRIAQDLPKLKTNNSQFSPIVTTKNFKHKVTTSNIEVKIREWKSYDLEYWESYGISIDWLKFGEVYPISRIFISNKENQYIFPAEKYAYCYVENKDNKQTLKIYQPFSNTQKWMNKHDASVWDLWCQLPEKGENLIITSSRKDALCLWENTGIPSVSLQGEGYIPKESVINQLKERFDNIYILYDNDFIAGENHGRIFGEKLAAKFNLIQLEIPTVYKTKDPSDFCKLYGRKALNLLITNLLKQDDLPF